MKTLFVKPITENVKLKISINEDLKEEQVLIDRIFDKIRKINIYNSNLVLKNENGIELPEKLSGILSIEGIIKVFLYYSNVTIEEWQLLSECNHEVVILFDGKINTEAAQLLLERNIKRFFENDSETDSDTSGKIKPNNPFHHDNVD